MIVHSADASPGLSVKRSGITLTEVLISILIMGIGMVSLATLFPLGLLRLREASRMSRSAYLVESAAADVAARGLLSPASFQAADLVNQAAPNNFPYWHHYNIGGSFTYLDPFVRDTYGYGVPISGGGDPGVGAGQGLPIAFDPLWRLQTGVYLNESSQEARFASGVGFVRADPDGGAASAYGLQRLTNFNRPVVTPISSYIPWIFVSPEDMVWQDPEYKLQYPMAGNLALTDPFSNAKVVDSTPSAVVPDLSQQADVLGNPLPMYDWRYTWMFTGRRISSGSAAGAVFDGDVVIFENRPFALDSTVSPILNRTTPKVAGEDVVEAVFGYGGRVIPIGTDGGGDAFGYGANGGKTVLLRWPASAPDPDVRVGGWIADVTYERAQSISLSRFAIDPTQGFIADAVPLSGQRCHWYQIVKVTPPAFASAAVSFGSNPGIYRTMTVQVATKLKAFTALDRATGFPVHVNAALVSPYVVQVVPRSFTVH